MSSQQFRCLFVLVVMSVWGCQPAEVGSGGTDTSTVPSSSAARGSAAAEGAAAGAPCAEAPPTGVKLAITSPCEGAKVEPRDFVAGVTADPSARVVVIIHPVETADYWVQPNVTVRHRGTWRVLCYFGEPGSAHAGKPYEVVAVMNPVNILQEGQLLPDWPEAEFRSEPVEVVRR